MTNEEAVKELKALLNMCDPSPLTKELEDALKMAIKALDQQPCEDAVSRSEAIDKLTKFYNMVLDDNGTKLNIRDIVGTLERLPSVTPQRPIGKWTRNLRMGLHQCSNCGKFCDFDYLYCPNCGAKMSGGGEE